MTSLETLQRTSLHSAQALTQAHRRGCLSRNNFLQYSRVVDYPRVTLRPSCRSSVPVPERQQEANSRQLGGWHIRQPPEAPSRQARLGCRAAASAKTVPDQHLAQVVAEETTDNIRYRHLIRSKSHIIQGDLGTEYGGTDFGPSPKEMVLSGLAMETSLTMRMYADRKNWPLRKIRVMVKEHGRGKGQLPDGLDVIIQFDGELSREQKAALLEVAGKSPVKNMLLGKMAKGISTRIAIKQKARAGAVPELSNDAQ